MSSRPLRELSPRLELTAVLAAGVVGAGLVFLGVRHGWAQVHTSAPRPLPGSDATVTGQDLVPAAGALALAGLAGLAAVLATRGLARRLTGLLLALLGATIAVTVLLQVTAAAAIRAASSNPGPAGSAGSGGTAGSVTAGGTGGSGSASPVAGFPAHVVMTGLPWRPLAVVGAVVLAAAGVLVAWRAGRWPVMSARYDAPGPARAAAPAPSRRPDTATIWESLSRGEDPTD
ncbi:MAG: Trp biosynthesis-associated membrane protein, partial [Actinomycetota bacterium]